MDNIKQRAWAGIALAVNGEDGKALVYCILEIVRQSNGLSASCSTTNKNVLGVVGGEADAMQNENTFIMLQIEDVEAVDCLDEILDVDGYEIIFVGPGDLGQSLRNSGGDRTETVEDVILKVASVMKNRPGKWWGLPCASGSVQKYYDLGARFFAMGADIIYERIGFQKDNEAFRALRL